MYDLLDGFPELSEFKWLMFWIFGLRPTQCIVDVAM